MSTFSSYFQIQALRDRLPFNIDFEIGQVKSEVTETIAGMEFAIKGDLVSRESWFFGIIEELNSGKTQEATLQLRTLASKLAKDLEFEGKEALPKAVEILWSGSEDYIDDQRYLDFLEENQADIQNLLELLKVSQNVQALNWLRVTFFILSRVTSNWSIGDTAGMTNDEISQILNLIAREANGGVDPETNTDAPVEVVEDEGKGTKG